MSEIIIWTATERVLTMLVFSIAVVGGIKYFFNAKNRENRSERMLLLGFAILLFCSGITILSLFCSGFYHQGFLENGIFTGIYDDTLSPVKELRLIKHITTYGGYVIFILQFERSLRKTHYLLTIISAILYIDYLIDYLFNWHFLNYHIPFMIVIFFLTITWLLIQSDLEFQNLTLLFVMGFGMFISLGIFSNPYRLQEASMTIPIEVIMLLLVISTLIITIPAFINIERILTLNPKPIFYFSLVVMVFIVLLQIFLILITTGAEYLITLILVILIILTSLLVYKRNMKYLKQRAEQNANPEKGQILTAFSKPKKVTEEEVSVSKEKKICLVCKGGISRYNIYICPECNSLYHQKCAKILEGQENACWACETAFDESKPVKLPKQEEEVQIGEEIHKDVKSSK